MTRPLSETELDRVLSAFDAPEPKPELIASILAAAASSPGRRHRGRQRWRRVTGMAIGATLLIGGAVAAAVGDFPIMRTLADLPALMITKPTRHQAPNGLHHSIAPGVIKARPSAALPILIPSPESAPKTSVPEPSSASPDTFVNGDARPRGHAELTAAEHARRARPSRGVLAVAHVLRARRNEEPRLSERVDHDARGRSPDRRVQRDRTAELNRAQLDHENQRAGITGIPEDSRLSADRGDRQNARTEARRRSDVAARTSRDLTRGGAQSLDGMPLAEPESRAVRSEERPDRAIGAGHRGKRWSERPRRRRLL